MANDLLALTPERIRENRRALGMTLVQFAQHIRTTGKRGYAPTKWTISRWEHGVKRPGPMYASVLLTIDRKVRGGDGRPVDADEPGESGAS